MSLSGSCLLSAVGGLIYKYDRHQIYERLPETKVAHIENLQVNGKTETDNSIGIYKSKYLKLKKNVPDILINFFRDFFESQAYILPINGIVELINNYRIYLAPSLITFVVYFAMYLLVSMVYFATMTPVYTSLLLFLGPFGLIISLVHTAIQTNQLTMMFMRLSHMQNFVVKKYLEKNNLTNVIEGQPRPIKFFVPPTTRYFWIYYLPKKIVKYILGFFTLTILLFISFIPIIGPFLFHILIAPVITRIYVSKFFRLRGMDSLKRNERFYQHLGRYYVLGIFAGFLENIPILSGFFLASNTIAATMWGIKEISRLEA